MGGESPKLAWSGHEFNSRQSRACGPITTPTIYATASLGTATPFRGLGSRASPSGPGFVFGHKPGLRPAGDLDRGCISDEPAAATLRLWVRRAVATGFSSSVYEADQL